MVELGTAGFFTSPSSSLILFCSCFAFGVRVSAGVWAGMLGMEEAAAVAVPTSTGSSLSCSFAISSGYNDVGVDDAVRRCRPLRSNVALSPGARVISQSSAIARLKLRCLQRALQENIQLHQPLVILFYSSNSFFKYASNRSYLQSCYNLQVMAQRRSAGKPSLTSSSNILRSAGVTSSPSTSTNPTDS